MRIFESVVAAAADDSAEVAILSSREETPHAR
jgi:hypothetical protein